LFTAVEEEEEEEEKEEKAQFTNKSFF